MSEEFDRFEEHMANQELDSYEVFAKRMEEKYPELFSHLYGGFSVGEGWWPIIETLCGQIDSYTKWRNNTRAAQLVDTPHDSIIPDAVPQVVVAQLKEKFGGLRCYYDGGDAHIGGMVRMAESWAGHSCEDCGVPATKKTTGWIKNVCDKHFEEREAARKERFAE